MTAPLFTWLTEPLTTDVSRAVERVRGDPFVDHVALMPDVHLADNVCIGTVLGSATRVFPAAVGGDIGCGMMVGRFDAPASLMATEKQAYRVLLLLRRLVPPSARPSGSWLPRSPSLDVARLSADALQRSLDRDGRRQLGTLGRGNHFIELQADGQGALWVMVHSGSRGLGPAVRDNHLRNAAMGPTGLASLACEGEAGRAYLADAGVAVDWARENRRALISAVEVAVGDAIGAQLDPATLVDCQHNHVRRERWNGQDLWVHRKGACPAADGEPGVVPGSMGTHSLHVVGRGHPDALGSCSHGAGRRLSRGAARQTLSVRDLRRQLRGVFYEREAAKALLDEAPAAYKDIARVMRAQRDLVAVVRQLRPLVSYKAAG